MSLINTIKKNPKKTLAILSIAGSLLWGGIYKWTDNAKTNAGKALHKIAEEKIQK